jgi:hypothetical protein
MENSKKSKKNNIEKSDEYEELIGLQRENEAHRRKLEEDKRHAEQKIQRYKEIIEEIEEENKPKKKKK